MSELERWLMQPLKWTKDHLSFIQNINCAQLSVSLEDVLQKSDEFCIEFPIHTTRNKILLENVPKHILSRNVQSAYPLVHEAVLQLCIKFLIFKVKFGTIIEKTLYSNMTILDFIQRLLTKRAVMFLGNSGYLLKNGLKYNDETGWENIGTDQEKHPLVLEECLSYDEQKLSSLLCVSSYSYFINNGARRNQGIIEENRQNIEQEGIIINLIGPRLNKPNYMEFQDIIISQKQNTVLNGYGDCNTTTIQNLFSNFYHTIAPLYNNIRYGAIENILRYKILQNGCIFDNEIYAKRLIVTFDTLFIEANYRAQKVGKFAYIHLIGVGLGNWKVSDHQEDIFVDVLGFRISVLSENLNSISDIHLSYFGRTISCHGYTDGNLIPIINHPKGGIRIFISERSPFQSLQNPEKLLVVSYASDSNSLPGNEFWIGCIDNSSNSATAASSQIAEIHNPIINPMVCAENLRIVTTQGIVSVSDYIERLQKMENPSE